jgi:hypothetical protein
VKILRFPCILLVYCHFHGSSTLCVAWIHKRWLEFLDVVAAPRCRNEATFGRTAGQVFLHSMPNRFERYSMFNDNQGLGERPVKALTKRQKAL